jgi:transposase-like protein
MPTPSKNNLNLFFLKQCAVLLHEVVQSLHLSIEEVSCPFCKSSSNTVRKAKSKEDATKGAHIFCKKCSKTFVVIDNKNTANKIVDILLLLGDAGVPMPPKRDT